MVKVNNSEIEFTQGMTAAQAIKISGEILDKMIIVLINGRIVAHRDLNTTIIEDNTKMSLLRLVSGG